MKRGTEMNEGERKRKVENYRKEDSRCAIGKGERS